MGHSLDTCFHTFEENFSDLDIPREFTFPFNYQVHPFAEKAALLLQEKIRKDLNPIYAFGHDEKSIGKMFGVLVVQKKTNMELGFLCAFSGKIKDKNHYEGFVPPIFDLLEKDSFFRKGEDQLNDINQRIVVLENDSKFVCLKSELESLKNHSAKEINDLKSKNKVSKALRKETRTAIYTKALDARSKEQILRLEKESQRDHFLLKDLKKHWKRRLDEKQMALAEYESKIHSLKKERKALSKAIQKDLFAKYSFLNYQGEKQNLLDIFKPTIYEIPPAGAGECAAPRLLQYAYENALKPLALAEFWWGKSPKKEVRRQGYFYPACKSRCKPILAHMLQGLDIAPDPTTINLGSQKEISIIYEDACLSVINKPEGLLSVPGKQIDDSVFLRMKQKYPTATGPIIVHRLDMSTSGIMLIAKDKHTHKMLQEQFIKKVIIKQYVAVLDGELITSKGIIDLPLRVDLDNRPMQLICYEHGKSARTKWSKIHVTTGKTRIAFIPVTGRTHQLRMHAAHPKGLNMPIVGDDLYGKKGERLHLHAEEITFMHPETSKKMHFKSDAPF